MKTSLLICLCLSVLAVTFAAPKEARKDTEKVGDSPDKEVVKPKPQTSDKTDIAGDDTADDDTAEDDTVEDDNSTEEEEAMDSDQDDEDSAADDEDEDEDDKSNESERKLRVR